MMKGRTIKSSVMQSLVVFSLAMQFRKIILVSVQSLNNDLLVGYIFMSIILAALFIEGRDNYDY